MERTVDERVVAKLEHALPRRFAVGLERMRRRGLVKRQPEAPFPAQAVGEVPVAQCEYRAAADELLIHEIQIEMAAIRVAAVHHDQLRGRAQKILLDQADVPCFVAGRARKAGLWLRAPAVRRDGAQRELAARFGANGIHPYRAKHAE